MPSVFMFVGVAVSLFMASFELLNFLDGVSGFAELRDSQDDMM